MKKYEVLVSFYYEKKTYPVGDSIELSEQDAKQLLRANYIKELDEVAKNAKKESKKQAEPEQKADETNNDLGDEPNDLGEVDKPSDEPKPKENKKGKQ